ncbi:MAG: D-aminoacyl-tRNA deacylase [archaeon]
MRFAIIVSEKDMAGMNIRDHLLTKFAPTSQFYEGKPCFYSKIGDHDCNLYTLKNDTIYSDNLEKSIIADHYIFATRHQSKSGEKTLSVHLPGNFGKAEFGGASNTLCRVHPGILKEAFILLNRFGKDLDYAITLECTHHGPSLDKPVFFIEIGSKEEQWRDNAAAIVITKVIIETIRNFKNKDFISVIGFGGSHYCAAFNKIELESDIALSHICPKYAIENISEVMITQMISKTNDKISLALLDWNGLSGKDKQKLKYLLDKLNINYKRTKDVNYG